MATVHDSLSEKYRRYLDSLDDNVTSPKKVSKVGIIGGGMAGLYCALKLKQRGITVKVFEATDRVGGRIYTHKFSDNCFFEAGATRISAKAVQVIDLVKEFNLELIDYVNSCPKGNRAFFNGKKDPNSGKIMTVEYVNAHPDKMGFPNKAGATKTAETLLKDALAPVVEKLIQKDKLDEKALKEYEHFTLHDYLAHGLPEDKRWSEQKIDYVEVMLSATNEFQTGLVDCALTWDQEKDCEWKTIKGGMYQLPEAMAAEIGWEYIELQATVVSIAEDDNKVKVGYFDSDGEKIDDPLDHFDAVILALPPSAIRMIPDRPRWPVGFERCLRTIHFNPVYKMGVLFKSRFWERDDYQPPSKGGKSITDLPCRWVMYPNPNDQPENEEMGVLVVNCGMNDSSHWLPKTKEEKKRIILKNLKELYPEVDIHNLYVDSFAVEWALKWPLGNTNFYAGQYTSMYSVMKKCRGNIYFAGEHLSVYHSSILGAIDSAKITCQNFSPNSSAREVKCCNI